MCNIATTHPKDSRDSEVENSTHNLQTCNIATKVPKEVQSS